MPAIFVTKRDDVPEGLHFVILEFDTIDIPGDERSRTDPGHGYPASKEPVVRYRAYTDRDEWVEAIAARQHSQNTKPFVAMESNPARITTEVRVTVD